MMESESWRKIKEGAYKEGYTQAENGVPYNNAYWPGSLRDEFARGYRDGLIAHSEPETPAPWEAELEEWARAEIEAGVATPLDPDNITAFDNEELPF